jgi:hypothetical protein
MAPTADHPLFLGPSFLNIFNHKGIRQHKGKGKSGFGAAGNTRLRVLKIEKPDG